MKIRYYSLVICFFIGAVSVNQTYAQNETRVEGKVIEKRTKQALIGVNIKIKDKLIGTITDTKGNFILSTKTQPPFTLVISIVGYESQEHEISTTNEQLDIILSEATF